MRDQSARRAPSGATFLRSAQAAAILPLTPTTINRWTQAGRLPFQRTIGGHRRYPEQANRELAASLVGEVAAS
jgi:excisionase family DNA binding protein